MAERILIPFELPDPEPLSDVLVDDIASLEIVVLGYYPVPEQTPPEMAREQFIDEAKRAVGQLADELDAAGATVTTRIVFGKNRADAIDQIAREEDCVAELDPAPTDQIRRILVPIPDVAEFTRLPKFVDVLNEESTHEITLFHVLEGGVDREHGERIVSETKDGLVGAGFDPDAVDTLVVEGDEHDEEILRVAESYDAVVMYEAESRLTDHLFGTLSDRIANQTGDPVIVVRRDY
ncbi:MAG: universal stress protein [Halobacteriota archaeon]